MGVTGTVLLTRFPTGKIDNKPNPFGFGSLVVATGLEPVTPSM